MKCFGSLSREADDHIANCCISLSLLHRIKGLVLGF